MRYFWALMAYVTAIVVAVASCGNNGRGNGFSGSTGTGGLASSGTGQNGGGDVGGGLSTSNGGSPPSGVIIPDASSDGPTCPTAVTCAGKGYTCGFPSDGCSGTLNCGTCGTNTICSPT